MNYCDYKSVYHCYHDNCTSLCHAIWVTVNFKVKVTIGPHEANNLSCRKLLATKLPG